MSTLGSMTNKNKHLSPTADFGKQVPDTYIKVKDANVQTFLDCFREKHEKAYGKPVSDKLWAHQLSPEEQKKLSREELYERTPPWYRALWKCLITDAINSGRIEELPQITVSVLCREMKLSCEGGATDGIDKTSVRPPKFHN